MSVRHFRSGAVAAIALAFLYATAPSAQGASPAPAAGVLATQSYDEAPGVQVVLTSVARTPGYLTVKWAYRNTSKEPQVIGHSYTGMGSSEVYSLVWDAYLLAPAKVPVARDPQRSNPIAAMHAAGKDVKLAPGQTFATWAKFPDPGPEATTVTVVIPGAAPFENVPIS